MKRNSSGSLYPGVSTQSIGRRSLSQEGRSKSRAGAERRVHHHRDFDVAVGGFLLLAANGMSMNMEAQVCEGPSRRSNDHSSRLGRWLIPVALNGTLGMLGSMPVTVSVDPAGRFAVLTLRDEYSIVEWRAAVLAALDTPVYGERRTLLVDRRDTQPPSTSFVQSMVDFLARHVDRTSGERVAIVVSDEVSFGMGRMTQLRTEATNPGSQRRVFRQYDEAVRWLTS